MSISMFQFDPLSLGITNSKPKSHHLKPHLHLRKNHNAKQTVAAQKRKGIPSGNARKKETDFVAMNETIAHQEAQGAVVDRNSNTTTNATKTIDKESKKKLNANPTPTNSDALEHLKNVKFDGTHKNASAGVKLLANNTKGGITAGNTTNTNANSTVNLPKEELLFYKNKTKDVTDGSEELNSVKLIKTTTPDSHNGELPILQTINATLPTNASLNNNATVKLNKSLSLNNDSSTTNLKNDMAMTLANKTRNNIFVIPKNASLLPDEGQTVFDVRKRQEILSHFIPAMEVSNADRRDSFQSGSRKHKLHHMYPECYHCPKQSNYTSCVRKAKLMKCDEGLNNICFTKSHKHDGKRHISYEMGCTSHKECGTARAFPCKDGSKHCFTCCQFNRCNASPHHGDFEVDDINLDELTKEDEKKNNKNSSNVLQSCPGVMATAIAITHIFVRYLW